MGLLAFEWLGLVGGGRDVRLEAVEYVFLGVHDMRCWVRGVMDLNIFAR